MAHRAAVLQGTSDLQDAVSGGSIKNSRIGPLLRRPVNASGVALGTLSSCARRQDEGRYAQV